MSLRRLLLVVSRWRGTKWVPSLKSLCVLNQTRGSFLLSPHGQADGERPSGDSMRPAYCGPVGGARREAHDAFSLGNALLDFNFRRKGGGYQQQPAATGSHGFQPQFSNGRLPYFSH